MEIDEIRLLRIIVIICVVAFGAIFIFARIFADDEFFNSAYYYKVDKIEFREGHRGYPHILIDSVWRLLTIEEMRLAPYLQPGDSIVKRPGSKRLTVYRRKANGKVEKKDFD